MDHEEERVNDTLRATVEAVIRRMESFAAARQRDADANVDPPDNVAIAAIVRAWTELLAAASPAAPAAEPRELVDEYGDPVPPDPHSPDWYDGFAEGQEAGLMLAAQRAAAQPGTSEPGLLRVREVIVDTMLNDGPDDTVYDIADRVVARLAAADSTPPASEGLRERLAEAMDEAFTYEDRDNAEPTLRFVDDREAFWRPFAAKVAAALASPAQVDPAPELPGVPLDVERLARALAEVRKSVTFVSRGHTHESLTSDEVAAGIAAEYARLSPTPEEQP